MTININILPLPLHRIHQQLHHSSDTLPRSSRDQRHNMETVQSWVSKHKLASIGALWASGIGATLVTYSCKKSPMKPSLRLIHARMHAQALTLAVLSGAAAYHYYEKSDVQPKPVADIIPSPSVTQMVEYELHCPF